MTSRAEVTTKYAKAYAKDSKKDKGRVLDAVTEVTGWSRDNARRRLVAAAQRAPGSGRQVAKRPRKPRAPKYSYDALKVLQKVTRPPSSPRTTTWSASTASTTATTPTRNASC